MNNTVFLPIEIVQREYIGKLLLSFKLLEKGMPVVIGHKSPVINLALKASEPGIFFYKSTMAGGMEEISSKLREKKFAIMAQDEETGIIFNDYEDFFKNRPSINALEQLDCFFTWGEEEYSFLTEKFKSNVVKNYGGLRACMWGELGKKFYKNTIEKLNKKFGEYILICSNLATYNSFLKKKNLIKHLSQYRHFNLNEFEKTYNAEKKIFFQYLNLIELISKRLNKKVIIRPHLVENIKNWEDKFKSSKNIFVEREGEILPWILASDYIIQNNCTSAIEASAADIPVITFAEEKKDLTILSKGKENIPNKLSLNVLGNSEFIEISEKINFLWNSEENKKKRKKLLKKKLKEYGTITAAEDIAQEIIRFTGEPNTGGNKKLGKDSILYDVIEFFRSNKFRPKTTSFIMDSNKRIKITYDKIKDDIEKLSLIIKSNKKIKIKRIAPSTFYLSIL